MKLNAKKWTALLPLLICSSVFADGGKVGNGGDAYLINGRPYSFDLVEEGVESSPYFDMSIAPDSQAVDAYRKTSLPADLASHFGRKMAEVRLVSEHLYQILISALGQFDFVFVNASLEDIDDASSQLKLNPRVLVQAAVRAKNRVQISSAVWQELDFPNRIALLLHELIFSLQSPETHPHWAIWHTLGCDFRVTQDGTLLTIVNSDATRKLVGALFNARKMKDPASIRLLAQKTVALREIERDVAVTLKFIDVGNIRNVKISDQLPFLATCPEAQKIIRASIRIGNSQLVEAL